MSRIAKTAPDTTTPALTCPDCHATFEHGRWQWKETTLSGFRVCPACERMRDQSPAGVVTIEGAFPRSHRGAIMDRIRHLCDRAYLEQPLDRLMRIDEDDDIIRLATTSEHLARSIASALHASWHGTLHVAPDAAGVPHITWRC